MKVKIIFFFALGKHNSEKFCVKFWSWIVIHFR